MCTEPWVVSGQTALPSQQYTHNPTPNDLGFLGEQHSLPYTVPEGKQLRLHQWGIEAYMPSIAVIGMNLWVGTTFMAPYCLPSVNNGVGVSNTFESARGWVLPAGAILNVALYNAGPTNNITESWWVEGVLEDVGV